MCGIAGFLLSSPRWAEPRLREVVRGMHEAVRHRGPDGCGEWAEVRSGAALGHRRLSILDLSEAGSQPMVSASGRHALAYNGEVYNFAELRRDLEQAGCRFRGHSDTEVLLEGLERWGAARTLPRLNGMFAFALWEVEGRRLTLARDRAGKKPLYYGWADGAFVFGSELKALRAFPGFPPDVDRQALGRFLQLGWVPAPRSIYAHARKLPPGCSLTVEAGWPEARARPLAYWSPLEAARSALRGGRHSALSEAEAAGALESLLADAVQARMVADVEVGALLSGGIDSSLAVALMQRASPVPVKTFTIGFEVARYDESEAAAALAAHLGTEHTALMVRPSDALEVIPELPRLYDEPFADPSEIPTFIVSRLARQQVKVALSGDGGDELFAGYKRYPRALKAWRRWGWLPGPVRTAVVRTLERLGSAVEGSRLADKALRSARGLGAGGAGELSFRMHQRCARPEELVEGFRPDPAYGLAPPGTAEVPDPLQAMMYADFAAYLADDVLVKVDRASMAVGLEVRCPFLDPRVLEFAWALPRRLRLGSGGGKVVPRRLLERLVPGELARRPKRGFSPPVGAWLRGPLRPWAEELLESARLEREGYLNSRAVRKLWEQHLGGSEGREPLLWAALMFQAWRQQWGA